MPDAFSREQLNVMPAIYPIAVEKGVDKVKSNVFQYAGVQNRKDCTNICFDTPLIKILQKCETQPKHFILQIKQFELDKKEPQMKSNR